MTSNENSINPRRRNYRFNPLSVLERKNTQTVCLVSEKYKGEVQIEWICFIYADGVTEED